MHWVSFYGQTGKNFTDVRTGPNSKAWTDLMPDGIKHFCGKPMGHQDLKVEPEFKIVSSTNTGSQSIVNFTRPFKPVVNQNTLTLSPKTSDYEISFGIGQFAINEENMNNVEVNVENNKMKIFKMPIYTAPLRMGCVMKTVQWGSVAMSVFFSIY